MSGSDVTIFLDERAGGTPQWRIGLPEDCLMRVPDIIKSCPIFVRFRDGRGATAFAIACAEAEFATIHTYLVTAQHVSLEMQRMPYILRANAPDENADLFFDRGGVVREIIPTQPLQWWYHPTEPKHVDIAIAPFEFSVEEVMLAPIPITMLLTDDHARDHGIGIGDETYTVGLFTFLNDGSGSSDAKNRPILRTGNLAVFPEVKVATAQFGQIDAYLVEARSLGGLSGSPVFVTETNARALVKRNREEPILWGGTTFLLGVMHGHWNISRDEMKNDLALDIDASNAAGVNLGVAIVSPASKLLDIVNQPALVKIRHSKGAKSRNISTEDLGAQTPTQTTRALKPKDRIDIPVPTREQFERDLAKATKRRTS